MKETFVSKSRNQPSERMPNMKLQLIHKRYTLSSYSAE